MYQMVASNSILMASHSVCGEELFEFMSTDSSR